MSAKTQHNNIIFAIIGFISVIVIVALIGWFALDRTPETIQGELEVGEYRVACKLPGRVVELRVKEGDYVHVGDTVAILEMPEVSAQQQASEATVDVASALIDEGVMSAQKRDEALAAYKVTEAQVVSAKAQYELAKSGAREQEKRAAAKQVQVAKGAVNVVKSILKETVQVAGAEGEVSAIYPKQGELVGLGSPIMSISQTKDMWGAFNVREDQLKGMKVGDKFKAYVPAFDKEIEMQVFSMKDEGSYAVWKATKTTGQYDLKTFEVKARTLKPFDGLRPGMSLIVK